MVAYEYSLTKKYLVSDELLESIRNNDIQTVDRLLNTGIHPKMILHVSTLLLYIRSIIYNVHINIIYYILILV